MNLKHNFYDKYIFKHIHEILRYKSWLYTSEEVQKSFNYIFFKFYSNTQRVTNYFIKKTKEKILETSKMFSWIQLIFGVWILNYILT